MDRDKAELMINLGESARTTAQKAHEANELKQQKRMQDAARQKRIHQDKLDRVRAWDMDQDRNKGTDE